MTHVLGTAEATCNGVSVRWNVTANLPIGDVFEQGLARFNRQWIEVDMIYWYSGGVRISWYSTNTWRIPVSRVWDSLTNNISIHFTLRFGNSVSQIPWNDIYQNWLYTRDRLWTESLTIQQANEISMRMNETNVHHQQPVIRNHGARRVRLTGQRPTQRIVRDNTYNLSPDASPVIQAPTPVAPLVFNPSHWGLDNMVLDNTNVSLTSLVDIFGRDTLRNIFNPDNQVRINWIGFLNDEEETETLTEESLDRLSPKYSYELLGTNERTICPITQVEIADGTEVRKLPCEHIFTAEAIDEWLLNRSNKCPVCREVVE